MSGEARRDVEVLLPGRGLTTPPIAVESMLSATTGRLRCDRGSASARIWAAQIPSEGPPPSVRRLFGAEF